MPTAPVRRSSARLALARGLDEISARPSRFSCSESTSRHDGTRYLGEDNPCVPREARQESSSCPRPSSDSCSFWRCCRRQCGRSSPRRGSRTADHVRGLQGRTSSIGPFGSVSSERPATLSSSADERRNGRQVPDRRLPVVGTPSRQRSPSRCAVPWLVGRCSSVARRRRSQFGTNASRFVAAELPLTSPTWGTTTRPPIAKAN